VIPIHQTKFGKGGNCFSACIASILELKIDDVPLFIEKGKWYHEYQIWLRSHDLDFIALKPWLSQEEIYIPNVYSIVSGDGPRGLLHSVVYLESNMVHDPHPEGGGVKNVIDWIYIVPKKPKRIQGEAEKEKVQEG